MTRFKNTLVSLLRQKHRLQLTRPYTQSSSPNSKIDDAKPPSQPPFTSAHLQSLAAEWRDKLAKQREITLEQAGKQLSALGLKLNEVTGYREVERLKREVTEKELQLRRLRDEAKSAKLEYEEAVTRRATTQSEVNTLLERKHAWSDTDVSRFTTLVRSDHSSNQQVASSTLKLRESETTTDKAFSELMQAILQRYHEEQVWSDKIRNISTYANLLGLVINLVVFVGAIAFVEPWKRRRLVERLEERIAGIVTNMESSVATLGDKLEEGLTKQHQASDEAIPNNDTVPEPDLVTVAPSTSTPLLTQNLEWLPAKLDLLAEPSNQRDLIVSGVVGLGAGATLAASLLLAFR